MANVGTSTSGKVLIGAGNGVSPTFASIGTNSGLTQYGVVIAEGNGAFQATSPGTLSGQILQSGGAAANPSYSTATYPSTTTVSQLLYSSAANTVAGLSTANNGTLVTSSAGVPSILAGPGTTGNILQSNAAAAPSFSTATYPSTTTVSQLLYSSSANVVAGLSTANSATLLTNSSGVPSWSASLTNGQVLIGNTGGSPTPGTITAGSGVTVSNGAGTITISSTGGASPAIGVSNIGIAYSAGTFTVRGATASLSASNPGYVTMQSKSVPGQLVTIAVTADQTFTDGSAGTTDNARFGLISGNVWGANDIPFFLYAVQDDTETAVNFMISRNPAALVSPASTSISKTGAIVNVDQSDFFSLGNVTVTSYDNNPCVNIGCFRMQFTGATDSWTVTALSSTVDGIGMNFNNRPFSFPKAVQGAAANTHWLANGGTAPVYTSDALNYVIHLDGLVDIYHDWSTNTTAGVGAVAAVLSLPYSNPTVNQNQKGFLMFVATGTNTYNFIGCVSNTSVQPQVLFWQGAVVGYTVNTVFGANTKGYMQLTYKAY